MKRLISIFMSIMVLESINYPIFGVNEESNSRWNSVLSAGADITSIGSNIPEGIITYRYEINKDNTITLLGFSEETIDYLLFQDKNYYMDTLVIPSKLTVDGQTYQVSTIGPDAFCTADQLGVKNVVIEEGITGIKGYFITADLDLIIFPASLKTIDSQAFLYLSAEKVILSGENPYYTVDDNIIYSKDGKTLVWAPSAEGTFTIPETVTRIAGGAFISNQNLTKVVMNNNVTYIGDYAFYETSKLNVVFPEKLDYLGDYAFTYSNLNKLHKIPTVKKIGAAAFCGTNITRILIPEGVEEIGEGAFCGCSHVIKLTIPASVKKMGSRAFRFDVEIEMYEYDSKLKQSNISISKNNKYFSVRNGCLCNKKGTKLLQVLSADTILEVPDTVIAVSEGAMSSNHVVKKAIFNNKCLSIPKNCFYDCPKLEEIVVSSSVKTIYEDALEPSPGNPKRTIIFKGKTPPTIYRNLPKEYDSLEEVNWDYSDNWQMIYYIIVPKGCKSKYVKAFDKVKFVYKEIKEE